MPSKKKPKNLVIVESSAKAKTINKILGRDYVVKASYGHVMDLPRKGGLNIDLDTFEANYEVIDDPRKRKAVAELRKTAQDAPTVYLCSDPDREGEFIAQSLSEVLEVPKDRMVRVTFNEITPRAIRAAFEAPRQIDENLVNAQQARRLLDRIVGFKLSPLLWEKIMRGLSAGRVQSVALKLLVEREKAIREFQPQEYWTVGGTFGSNGGSFPADLRQFEGKRTVASAKDLLKSKGKLHIASGAEAEKITKKCSLSDKRPRKYKVASYRTRESSEKAPPPFITSTLQQASANRLGFAALKTMGIAQKLYEAGLITYMRTDSYHVSKEAQGAARTFVRQEFGAEYCPDKPNFYRSRKGAQEAHECVRPSYVDQPHAELPADERRLYALIRSRFLASQMSPATYSVSTCDLESDGISFRASGRVRTFDGWTKAYGTEGSDRPLPELGEGQELEIKDVVPTQHFTQPPPRFNDASLVKVLEASGVGRPSTYASTVQTILDRSYAERLGRGGRAPLRATELGVVVTDSLDGHFAIMDIEFTSNMEESLDEVEEGKVKYKDLLSHFWEGFRQELDVAKTGMRSVKEGKLSPFDCPSCNTKMFERISRFGPFFKCPSEKCGETMDKGEDGRPRKKEGPKKTGLTCDMCGGDMVLANGRFGEYLCCERYLAKVEKKVEGKRKPALVPECPFTMALTKKDEPRRKVSPVPTGIECEKCKKGNLVIRIASRKKNPDAFLSCGNFPKCRHTEKLPEELAESGEALLGEFRKLRAKDRKDSETFRVFRASEADG